MSELVAIINKKGATGGANNTWSGINTFKNTIYSDFDDSASNLVYRLENNTTDYADWSLYQHNLTNTHGTPFRPTDPAIGFGYNIGPTGARQTDSEPGWFWGMEAGWHAVGYNPWFEFYIQRWNATGSGYQRMFQINTERDVDSTPVTYTSFFTTYFTMNRPEDNANMINWSFNSGAQVLVFGKTGVTAGSLAHRFDVNAAHTIQQRGAGSRASNFITYPYIDENNALVMGVGGELSSARANYMVFPRFTNGIYFSDAGAVSAWNFGSTNGCQLGASGNKVGFLGATPIVRPTATGSRGANAALASLLTALANLGLIVDSTS